MVVAMSGGVDSSVAASVLKERGYEVQGMTMEVVPLKNFSLKEEDEAIPRVGVTEKAQKVARFLNIPHETLNLKKEFEQKVISNFCNEYAQGRTPNPCIRCNKFIKMGLLMDKALERGADYLATGHYAQVVYQRDVKRYLLKKGKDREKDQSYFLYPLNQKQFSFLLMPLGFMTKHQVQEKASQLNLPLKKDTESQEICFIPDDNYVCLLKKRRPESFIPGPIKDLNGNILGFHQGILHFTIGQRRGMGISASHPLYVVDIRSEDQSVVVGTQDQLYKKNFLVSSVNMIVQNEIPSEMEIQARIRYKHEEAPACLKKKNSSQAWVKFKKPQRAITPGQSVVFYRGDTVLGGGIIEKALD